MISEKDIRRAIRLAIKAKQIEKNPILEEEEDFGIKTLTELPTFVESPLLKRLKNNLKDKEEVIERAKRSSSHFADIRRYLA